MNTEAKAEDDYDFIQILRDEANEWHANSEIGSLLRQAAQRLSDSLDHIDNMENGLASLRFELAELKKTTISSTNNAKN